MTSEVCIHCIPSFCEKVCFFFFGIEVHIHSKICCKVEPEGLKVLISNEQPGLGRCCPDGVPGFTGPTLRMSRIGTTKGASTQFRGIKTYWT